ncbi:glycosyltransferase [Oscillatoria laete-virens NRMC-F 0139]|nr:glycosyltransferase [Oscillatoria laete-virens NRMC-F 0139]
MRFLQMAQTLNRGMGGFATAIYPLHQELNLAGHQSDLFGLDAGRSDLEQFARVHSFAPHFLPRLYYSGDYALRAGQFAREADSIHVHGLWVYPNLLAGSLARKHRKPLVIHPHGMLEPWALRHSRLKKQIARTLFENRNFRQAALWRALTHTEKSQIEAICPGARVAVIPNGVYADEFSKAAPPLTLTERHPELFNKKWLLFMSRIHRKKGLDILIGSWSKLHRNHPGWQLVIAGADDGYEPVLRQLIDFHDLQSRVTLTGLVTGQERLALLKNAQMFVLPSYSEGFSMAILEALASGLPVLASRNCNFPELAENGAGFLIEPQETELTANLGELLGCPEYYLDEMGKKGLELVRSRYDWGRVAEQFACAVGEIHS